MTLRDQQAADYREEARERYRDIRARAGRIRVDARMVDDVDTFLAMMSRCIVIRCEHDFFSRCFDYTVLSPDLPVLAENVVIPVYQAYVTRQRDGTVSVRFRLQREIDEEIFRGIAR